MRDLAALTWRDLPERPLVLIPVGSTEQHGPHLPLQTDTVIATELSNRLADFLGGYVAPAIMVGASGEHQGFPGVMSIGTDALRVVLIELARSLADWAGRVVFVNGHGGNVEAVSGAVNQLLVEQHSVQWLACAASGDAHAGRTETSLMLHLAPWLVRPHRAERGNTTPIVDLLPALRAKGVLALAPNGVLGDPTGASAAEGAEIFERMVEVACHEL